MRDHLPELAESIADIEGIQQIERSADANGLVHIVNEWRFRQQIPAAIRSLLNIGELSWIDRNSWDADTGTCSWAIETSFLREYIDCSGTTTFTAAMAGRGTRVTFAGNLDLKPGLLGSLAGIEPLITGFLEAIVTTVIPRNLRAIAEAAAAFELPR